MDEPFADFSGGESADVEKAQCGNRSDTLESNSSIQQAAGTKPRESGRGKAGALRAQEFPAATVLS